MRYKLDRTAFSMHALEDNKPSIEYWKDKTLSERLAASFYLNSVAFNFDIENPPRMDRTVFSMRKHKE